MKKLSKMLLSSLLLVGCVVGCGELEPTSSQINNSETTSEVQTTTSEEEKQTSNDEASSENQTSEDEPSSSEDATTSEDQTSSEDATSSEDQTSSELPGTSEEPSSSEDSTSSEEPSIVVNSVTISGQTSTTVYDGTTAQLTATVDGNGTNEVTWESSNENVTVNNGLVTFGKVSGNTDVTITARSVEDPTKFAEVSYTVKHSVINLQTVRGVSNANSYDEAVGLNANITDTSMVYSDVYDTRWYVEATVTPKELGNDAYPKFGLMTSTLGTGEWCKAPTAMFYVDAVKASMSNGWDVFNFVTTNSNNEWDWGGQRGFFNVSAENKVKLNEEYTIGLLRDGTDYYLYARNGANLVCYKHVVYTGIAADVPSYAFLGGWNTAYNAKNFRAFSGDEIDSLYSTPTELSLGENNLLLYIEEEYQLSVSANVIDYNDDNIRFTSSNENVATVTNNGLVKAGRTAGTTTITASLGELTATCEITVTDDPKVSVVLDGTMNDLIYTDDVKTNKFSFKAGTVSMEIYATRNLRGVYFFVEYSTTVNHSTTGAWWQGDNVEMRLNGPKGLIRTPNNSGDPVQFYAARFSNVSGHTYEDAFISDMTESNGTYSFTMELFNSYKFMGVNENDILGFSVGANPGGNAWTPDPTFGSANVADCKKILTSGIKNLVDEESCPSHVYNNYEVTTPSSCTTDGEETAYCKWCGHADKRVIKATGEHVWNYDALTVVTPSTCISEGVGSVPCTGNCGESKSDVVIPVDLHNHEGTFENGVWSCCGNRLENKVTFSYPANTNWITRNFIPAVMDGSSDWTVEMNIDMIRTNGNKDCARGWAGQVQVENANGEFDNNDANKWVFRQDWWGWGYYNPANGANLPLEQVNKDGNCGSHDADSVFTNGFADYIDSVLDNCNLVQTFSYSATTGIVTVVTKVTAKAGAEAGKVATVTYQSLAFPTGKKMEIGFGMLWNMEGSHIINSVKLTGTVIEGPHTHIDTVGLVA